MTQNITPYEASTALPPQAIPPEAKTKGAAALGRHGGDEPRDGAVPHNDTALGSNEARLSDGRVVRVRETSAMDDLRVEKLLASENITLQGVGVMTYTRACAVVAIESIDGERQTPPQSLAELEGTLFLFRTRDMNAVIKLYARVNGMDEGGDFRGER